MTARNEAVVLGGGGFLGSHLVPCLLERYAGVHVVDAAPAPAWLAGEAVSYTRADVADHRALTHAMARADVVVHAAFAPPSAAPDRLQEVNVRGTRSVCRAALEAGVGQVVLVSSTIVTAVPRRHPFLRSAALNRLDAYRTTRVAAEAEAATFGGFRLAVVRPKTFLGPGRVGGFALVFDLVRRGRAVPLAGPGTNRYQLVDVRDLADGVATLAHRGGDGVFHFGATSFGTVAHDLAVLAERAGTGARLRPLPRAVGRAAVRGIELAGLPPLAEWHHCTALGADSVVDTGRATSELGWSPVRSNAECLVDAYRWYVGDLAARGRAATTHAVPRSHRALRGLVARVLR